jgi:UDP-glucose 4-epimerase
VIAAVTGATGLVGRSVVQRLVEEGVAVRAWRRLASDLVGLPGSVEWIEGDLAGPETMLPLVDGADLLVHAALDHLPGRYRGGEGDDLAASLATNVGGSLSLLATAKRAGVRRAVVLSSRAVFGAGVRPGPIHDDDPVSPDTHYGAAKAALEAFVRSFAAEDGLTVAALRPTGVYGLAVPPERSKWFDLVAKALRGEPIPERAATEVHAADVAAAVWLLLTAPAGTVAGRSFNCSDMVISHRDVAALAHGIAGASGPLPPPGQAPANIMRCDGLERLGLRFGGRERLAATVAQLVAAVRASA